MDEIIIEKQRNELAEIDLEINQNTLITELKNLEVVPTAQEQTFKAGVGAFKEVKIQGDENLIKENIKAGQTIFGIQGDDNVVDTSDATATASKIHPDCNAYVKGKKVDGKMTIWNDQKPRCTPTHQKIINPENPFILTRQQTTGERYEEIIKIPADVIDPTWLQGKNICIRANYNPSLTYWTKDWRIEIATVNEGGKFFFKVYSGGYMEIWARNAANKTTNYTLYTANVNSIDELTINSWKKKDVVADGYTNGDLGPIGTLYAYSRDDSGKTTGLTGSSGVPGSANKFILKSNNSKTGYTEANAEFYSEITHSDLAKKISLKAEDICEGKTYLGVTGTMKAAGEENAIMDISISNNNTYATHGDNHILKRTLRKIPKEFNTQGWKSTSYLFEGCLYLEEIPTIDIGTMIYMGYAFCDCRTLKTITFSSVNSGTLTSVEQCFRGCSNLEEIPYFETKNVKTISCICYDCSLITTIPAFNTENVTTMSYAFQNCKKLIDVPLLNAEQVFYIQSIFKNTPALTNVGGLLNLGKAYTAQKEHNSTYTLDMSTSPLLTHESLMNIINNLYDLNLTYDTANGGILYTQDLVLGATNLEKLTAEEIAIATNKGWTVS